MCFSLDWIEHLLIFAVIVAAIFAILAIIVPWALSKISGGGIVGEVVGVLTQVLRIIVYAIIIIAVIVIVFALISCLWSYGGGIGSILPHGR